MNRKGLAIVGAGAAAGAFLLLRKKEVSADELPGIPAESAPSFNDLRTAPSLQVLEERFQRVEASYVIGKINYDTYILLYYVYRDRWYEIRYGGAS